MDIKRESAVCQVPSRTKCECPATPLLDFVHEKNNKQAVTADRSSSPNLFNVSFARMRHCIELDAKSLPLTIVPIELKGYSLIVPSNDFSLAFMDIDNLTRGYHALLTTMLAAVEWKSHSHQVFYAWENHLLLSFSMIYCMLAQRTYKPLSALECVQKGHPDNLVCFHGLLEGLDTESCAATKANLTMQDSLALIFKAEPELSKQQLSLSRKMLDAMRKPLPSSSSSRDTTTITIAVSMGQFVRTLLLIYLSRINPLVGRRKPNLMDLLALSKRVDESFFHEHLFVTHKWNPLLLSDCLSRQTTKFVPFDHAWIGDLRLYSHPRSKSKDKCIPMIMSSVFMQQHIAFVMKKHDTVRLNQASVYPFLMHRRIKKKIEKKVVDMGLSLVTGEQWADVYDISLDQARVPPVSFTLEEIGKATLLALNTLEECKLKNLPEDSELLTKVRRPKKKRRLEDEKEQKTTRRERVLRSLQSIKGGQEHIVKLSSWMADGPTRSEANQTILRGLLSLLMPYVGYFLSTTAYGFGKQHHRLLSNKEDSDDVDDQRERKVLSERVEAQVVPDDPTRSHYDSIKLSKKRKSNHKARTRLDVGFSCRVAMVDALYLTRLHKHSSLQTPFYETYSAPLSLAVIEKWDRPAFVFGTNIPVDARYDPLFGQISENMDDPTSTLYQMTPLLNPAASMPFALLKQTAPKDSTRILDFETMRSIFLHHPEAIRCIPVSQQENKRIAEIHLADSSFFTLFRNHKQFWIGPLSGCVMYERKGVTSLTDFERNLIDRQFHKPFLGRSSYFESLLLLSCIFTQSEWAHRALRLNPLTDHPDRAYSALAHRLHLQKSCAQFQTRSLSALRALSIYERYKSKLKPLIREHRQTRALLSYTEILNTIDRGASRCQFVALLKNDSEMVHVETDLRKLCFYVSALIICGESSSTINIPESWRYDYDTKEATAKAQTALSVCETQLASLKPLLESILKDTKRATSDSTNTLLNTISRAGALATAAGLKPFYDQLSDLNS